MTDRDLFYCSDFNCDGHSRSNEACPEALALDDIEEATVHLDWQTGITTSHPVETRSE